MGQGKKEGLGYSSVWKLTFPTQSIVDKTHSYLRSNEFEALSGNEHTIQMGFER